MGQCTSSAAAGRGIAGLLVGQPRNDGLRCTGGHGLDRPVDIRDPGGPTSGPCDRVLTTTADKDWSFLAEYTFLDTREQPLPAIRCPGVKRQAVQRERRVGHR